MTPEQKQRLEQIESGDQPWRQIAYELGDVIAGLDSDVDFLLSLVKSQECAWCKNAIETAHVSNDVRFCSVGCQTQYEHEPRVTTAAQREQKPTLKEHLADVPAMIAALKTREDETMELQVKLSNAVTSMRSACVEKVKAERRKHEQASPQSEDYEYHQAAAFALACVEDELESLSIEKSKE